MPKTQRDRTGEYLDIDWDGGEAETEMVRGHVERQAFIDSLLFEGRDPGEIAAIWHSWGRWNPDSSDAIYSQTFAECDGPGRGRFPVTIGVYRGFEHRHKRKVVAGA